ncbi:hypothetical protein [Maribacter algicola]|uniref:hypothetical protein n=1 Tax=Maribacter algicola TaxID=2498892 RepID=UPI001401F86B|nr:hypothetical protein [Maribacter algicola]
MNTITEVFKMFPIQISRVSKSERRIKQKSKTITSCFSEGIEEGCMAFTKEMGHDR